MVSERELDKNLLRDGGSNKQHPLLLTSQTDRHGMSTTTPRSVAVAVSGDSATGAAKGSRRAVQWAVDNVVPQADRFILVHVIPRITSIATPGI